MPTRILPTIMALSLTISLSANALAFNPDSIWVNRFGSAFARGRVNAIIRYGNDLIVGGDFDTVAGVIAHKIARWDGVRWWPLGSGISGLTGFETVSALAATDSGVVAGGVFSLAGGVSARNIAFWNGAAWTPLGTGINGAVEALAVVRGSIVAGGDFSSAGSAPASNIARWNGSGWSPLGSGMPTGAVYSLAAKGDSLFAGGAFVAAGAITSSFIALWDGASWQGVGGGTDGTVFAVAVAGTSVYVGGLFDLAGGSGASRVARWDGSTWSPLGSGIVTQTGFEVVRSVRAIGSDLYVGGTFGQAGTAAANNIAAWDGSTWNSLGSGVGGNGGFEVVNAIISDSFLLYLGGSFFTAGAFPSAGIAGWQLSTVAHFGTGWNLVSLPRVVQDSTLGRIFPQAEIGSLYSYDGTSYSQAAALTRGRGYWLLYTSASSALVPGQSLDSITVTIDSISGQTFQWVLIGSTSVRTLPDHIVSNPAGRIQPGTLYAYDGAAYSPPAAIIPGRGYWVLVRGACKVTVRGQ